MPSLFLLLPISLAAVIAIGAFFWWAIFAGQFDDTNEAANSILLDDDGPEAERGAASKGGDAAGGN
ncbi:cbb3-type cytochrome oxidase assembly protein CcoS [Parapusillimonas granuli]|uniref:Cbb3-type cytochrome oxidase assembly protein CcoS n=1 Tax=Parapusillimonas granuli TaxID=380911 RepID=A0A853G1L0_9BURK|nr:cbb3-type cytochrome oxidase assembly protein CcoS [Parapusillimonas granuli]MBB5217067.1 cbb3-type cytochrome oxidase maturation protein [Parapusillimonas granuli]MEB2400603.1 cbb3-type cytochrome oxidase assembly protein CcoS [Alcaligenaceae bacterium]NYT50169.1 cbb3-type cytochrome oxidase assembly protein CcoS [Parapusillimonas granuli]